MAKKAASKTASGRKGSAGAKQEKSSVVLKSAESTGEVFIADDVVANIAALATDEVEGVKASVPGITNGIKNRVGMKTQPSVKAEISGNTVRVAVTITIDYEYPIPETSQQVQSKVKSAVENMTGLTVSDVDVRVAAVDVK